MPIRIDRIRRRAAGALGLSVLPESNRRFLTTHLSFLIFINIPGVFINTFFFRQDGRISTVALYNGICVLGSALCMQVSSYIAIKKSPVFVLRTGVLLHNVLYMSLLLLQHQAAHFMPLLGLIAGFAAGFYWQGYNTLLQEVTDKGSLNTTLSIVGLCASGVSLTIPGLSGSIISGIGGSTGYTVVFVLSFAVSLFTAFLSTRIPNIRINVKPNLRGTYRKIFTTKSWILSFASEYTRGIRDTSAPLFITLLFFKLVGNEVLVGFNTMVTGLAALVSFYFSARIIRETNRVRCVMTATVAATVLFGLLFFNRSAPALFFISIVNAFVVTYILNPSIGQFYSMYENPGKDLNFTQVMAAHEIFLALGRVTGLLSVIAFSGRAENYPLIFLALNLTAFLGGFLLHCAIRARAREDRAAESAVPVPEPLGEMR